MSDLQKKLCQILFQIRAYYNPNLKMFEPARFLTSFLPQQFSILTNSLTPHSSALSILSSFRNFLHMAFQLFQGIQCTSHFLRFLETEFACQDQIGDRETRVQGQNLLGNLTSNLNEESLRGVVKSGVEILAVLFTVGGRTSCSRVSREEEDSAVQKILGLCQKLRFEVEIYNMTTGSQTYFDELMEGIFEIDKINFPPCAFKIFRKAISLEDGNISNLTKNKLLQVFGSLSTQAIPTLQDSSKTNFASTVPTVKKTTGVAAPVLMRRQQSEEERMELTKRMEEYGKLKRVKQIQKGALHLGKERTIYHMRKSKFVPKAESLVRRSSCSQMESFEFSTQMSSRSIQDYGNMRNGMGMDDDSMEMEEEQNILVRSTPRVCRRQLISQFVSRRLDFSDE